jgi:hypothetical protein
MSTATIKFDDKKIRKFLDETIRKSPGDLEKAMQKTTAESLIITKKTLPKRTGLLRKSYLSRKLNRFTYRIFPGSGQKLEYADAVEGGAAAHTIVPRRAKMLTIPLRDDVLVPSKARISASALDRLFRKLKNRKGKSKREIYDEVGIVLALKANIPRTSGQYNFRDKITPRTRRILAKNINQVFKKLGFK